MTSALTAARLRALFHYDQETGVFTRIKHGKCGPSVLGKSTWRKDTHGHGQISIDGRSYMAHRLAWLYVHGEFPGLPIDHINGIRADNRIANLRSVSNAMNTQNQRRARSDSKSKLLGAHPHRGRFQAQIGVDGRNHYLGIFATAEEAHLVYVEAKRRLHPGNTL